MTKSLDDRLLNDRSHDFEKYMPPSLPLPAECRHSIFFMILSSLFAGITKPQLMGNA